MIYGDDIRFRAVEKTDLETFVRWFNDPEVLQGLSMFLPMALWEEEQWFANLSNRPPLERPMAIEIQQKGKWVHIGNCGLHDVDQRIRQAEVGITIGEKGYWSQGHGTRAMRLLLQHAFDTLNLNRIFLRVYVSNPRAIRCYQKVGFVEEGRLRQAHFQQGEFVDVLIMGILRQEWDRNKGEA